MNGSGGFKSVTAAASGDAQVKPLMYRVTAAIYEVFRCFHGCTDLGQALILGMFFPEVSAESTLPLMKV